MICHLIAYQIMKLKLLIMSYISQLITHSHCLIAFKVTGIKYVGLSAVALSLCEHNQPPLPCC